MARLIVSRPLARRRAVMSSAVSLLSLLFVTTAVRAADAPPLLAQSAGANDVQLVGGAAAPAAVYVDAGDFAVTKIAAGLFAGDVERVSGKHPTVENDAAKLNGQAVLIGTIGHSAVIDRLIAEGKLDVSGVTGKWETFVIATVEHPLPNVDRALVIAGADRRGTAYGVFEVSEQIGVSPWYWWSDVAPTHHDTLAIKAGTHIVGPPTVKYRGIFINDEDWGLEPWAAKTFEPERGNIGPKTYAKVFELLLRLKANYLWPAMHPCSTEFGKIDENITLADDWGIVMGASHAEPMNRNNVHWNDEGRGPWRYDTNRDGVLKYWDEWAQKRGKYEAVWTVGMRGIHDSAMNGPSDVHARVDLLGQAILDQRTLLEKYVAPDATKVPQAFMPYKEVLSLYEAGLKVPDDVTLVWCDDNYGYVRQLSTPQEQKRAGHAGVYYHISYLGRPQSYLWINSTPPAQIWQQMQTALTFGADRIWVLNVGDIKPGEIGLDFWTKLAWKSDRWGVDAQPAFLREWATQTFGPEHAQAIADVMNRYYALAAQRKPELTAADVFGPGYGEWAERAWALHALRAQAEDLAKSIAPEQRDAFFELVLYPVRMFADRTEGFYAANEASRPSYLLPPGELDPASRVNEFGAAIGEDTRHFNQDIAGGKWNNIISVGGIARTGEYKNWSDDWFMASPAATKPTSGPTTQPEKTSHLVIWLPGHSAPLVDGKPIAERDDDVDVAADAATVAAPWTLTATPLGQAAGVPNGAVGAETLDPAKATPLRYSIEVKTTGHYGLWADVCCPTDKDDSFFVRIDGGAWQTWNGIAATDANEFDWRKQGDYDLSAGPHTIEIANREDGTRFRRLRLTQAQRPERAIDRDRGVPATEARIARPGTDRIIIMRRDPAAGVDAVTSVKADAPWMRWLPMALGGETAFDVDWSKVPAGAKAECDLRIERAGRDPLTIHVVALSPTGNADFYERDGIVSIEAEHPTASTPDGKTEWKTVPGLGRTGDGAITVMPFDAPSVDNIDAMVQHAASTRYEFDTTTADVDASLHVYTAPTYRAHDGRGVRYAVAIDDAKPQIVDASIDAGASGESGAAWSRAKVRNIVESMSRHHLGAAGKHTLRLWMVDPGVVVDKFVLDLGTLQPSELGPPETRRVPPSGSSGPTSGAIRDFFDARLAPPTR